MDGVQGPPPEGPIASIAEPGIKAESQLLFDLRREVATLLHRNQTSFPGAQPVSFARKHLDELRHKDYYVCEKSDGIRYLLYLTEDDGREIHYLIDRKNDYWFIKNSSFHFPRKDDLTKFHTRTLIDGELVMDDVGKGQKEPRFLVFDCLVLDGQDLMSRTLDKRLAYFNENIYKPYRDLFKQYPEEKGFQPFWVEMKSMQLSYGIEMMFRDILPKLRHGNDGLIFTCVSSEYKHGTDPHILKWKPPEENTVDCRLRLEFPKVQPDPVFDDFSEPFVDYEGVPHSELWSFLGDGRYQYFADVHITEDEWETLKGLGDPLVDRIVECHKDDQGRWRIIRFRDDKSEANHISTIKSVMESIEDRVTEKDLAEAAKSIKDNWKLRKR
ncbi:mRNA-capping enzyme subunit alpha [Colletotrichum sidae]|uniref:mRNA-capping enzyme subunit alpha n=1 Tax=Colletotrichum sidae TaxID=1347389 RepID=A0A4V3HZ33_9PEZI|nr:mRNA-capping enzyme subunit alpha [Colletotrichum sidae]